MNHKRETDRERRVVRAVIEVSKTHQECERNLVGN